MSLPPVSTGDPHPAAHNAEREAINNLETEVGQRIRIPASPMLGSVLRWDGDTWVASKVRILEGEGSPEGVVSGPVGSRYVDTDANAEYYKGSGTGTTGWVPQNVSAPWTNVTPGTGYIHVSGNTAQFSMANNLIFFRGALRRTSGSSTVCGTIPAAYAPDRQMTTMVRAALDWIRFTISTTGTLSVSTSIETNQDIYLESISGTPYRVS